MNKITNRLKYLLPIVILTVVIASGCKTQQAPISFRSSLILLDSTIYSDTIFEKEIAPYRDSLLVQMNQIIGFSDSLYRATKPSCALSNWVADAMYDTVFSLSLKNTDIPKPDFAIVNIKGLRSGINAGPIYIKNLFELMPFENQIVMVSLTGNQIVDLFRFMGSENGDGLSNASFTYLNGQLTDSKIGKDDIDLSQTYHVIAPDYLANGGDYYSILTQTTKKYETGLKTRDVLIDHVKKQCQKNKFIQLRKDNPVTILSKNRSND